MGNKDELQEGLDELRDMLNEAIGKAEDLYSISKDYRCFGGQLLQYTIATLNQFMNNKNQYGSMESLQNMLDNNTDGYED